MSGVSWLDVTQLNDRLRYRLIDAGSETNDGLGADFEVLLDDSSIRELERGAETLLRGRPSASFSGDARKCGGLLYRSLIPKRLQERLPRVSGPLRISVEASLSGLPWELLFDGDEHWGLRYALGKRINVVDANRHPPERPQIIRATRKPRALIIGSNPRGDLPFVDREVDRLCGVLEDRAEVTCVSDRLATVLTVSQHLSEGFDLIHYCGHVRADGRGAALVLAGEKPLSGALIEPNMSGAPLVFLNGCASVRGSTDAGVERWQQAFSSVAFSFLFGGAAAVVGTLCDVTDDLAATLAEKFYEKVLEGLALGEALRESRAALRKTHESSPTWLSFVLYGNPGQVLAFDVRAASTPVAAASPAPAGVRVFDDAGAIVIESLDVEALDVLTRGRAEALGHSAEQVALVDLLLGLVPTRAFKATLQTIGPAVAAVLPLIINVFRTQLGSGGQAPASRKTPTRQQLDRDVITVLERAAQAATADRPVGARDLLVGLLRTSHAEINRLLEAASLNAQAMVRALDATSVPPPSPPLPVQVSGSQLFDPFGQLKHRAIAESAALVLANAAAEASGAGDRSIDSHHLLAAVVASPLARRTLGLSGADGEIAGRIARVAVYTLFGKPCPERGEARLPDRYQFTPAVLQILDAACASLPMSFQALLVETRRALGPGVEHLLANSPVTDALVRALVAGPRTVPASATPPARTASKPSPPLSGAPEAARASTVTTHDREAFDSRAQRLMREASSLASPAAPAPEHLLLAMLRQPDGLLGLALAVQGVRPEDVAAAKLTGLPRGQSGAGGLSDLVKGAAALCEPGERIGEEHLLRALCALPGALDEVVGAWRLDREQLVNTVSMGRDGLTRRAATPALFRFGRDLTEEASNGRLTPVIGREEELRQMELVLARPEKANVLLLGEAGVGKTAIVEGLAVAIASGTAPPHLLNRRIIEIEAGRLVAGASLQGELESRVQAVLRDVEAHPEVILFFDEFHAFTSIGGHGDRTALTFANQIKSALARGRVSVISATTEQEFASSVERDPALMRRFRVIRVGEPSHAETVQILRGVTRRIEERYHLSIDDDALTTAVRLADRYLPGSMPDKARDLLVDACASHLVAQPADESGRVTRGDVSRLVAAMTKIPVEGLSIADGDEDAVRSLEAALARRVVGQAAAVSNVAARLAAARLIRDPKRPLAVLLFVGPGGVGKTEMARAIAEEYCGDASALVALPMNEFNDRLSISKLLGVGPGWLGHDEEPLLVSTLKRRPRSVVLFDDIDQAHPDVCLALLRLFADGALTDPRTNRNVNGREAIYVMTSSLERGGTASIGFAGARPSADPRSTPTGPLPAELVSRVDGVVVFGDLDDAALCRVAALKLDELAAWVLQAHQIALTFTGEVATWVVRQAAGDHGGARAVVRAIQTHIREPLGSALQAAPGLTRLVGSIVNDALHLQDDAPSSVHNVGPADASSRTS